MEFENIEQLKQAFIKGTFDFQPEIQVQGFKYISNFGSSYNIRDMKQKNYKAMWVYFTPQRKEALEAGLDHAVLFLWGFSKNNNILPYDVRVSSKARIVGPIIEQSETNDDVVTIDKNKIIGDIVDLSVSNLPGSKQMRAKIDTGADISSLHADSWVINEGKVSFVSPELSDNKITMPVLEKQAIKLSNGSVEYRPVIQLNIEINNIHLDNCIFNLNDRGSMKYPVLIGQNVLEAGGFMVDPSMNDEDTITNEDINWDELQEEVKNDNVDDYINK